MKTTKKTSAPKTTKPPPKKGKITKERAAKDAAVTTATSATTPKPRDPRLPAAGTTLTRTWHKKEYEVKVGADDFTYGGKPFPSLSAVAREIIGGAQVNGFLWFGLVPRQGPAPTKAPTEAKAPRGAKSPSAPERKAGGYPNDLATPEGQRAALLAAGFARKTPKKAVSK